jgi:hypothetical protein
MEINPMLIQANELRALNSSVCILHTFNQLVRLLPLQVQLVGVLGVSKINKTLLHSRQILTFHAKTRPHMTSAASPASPLHTQHDN